MISWFAGTLSGLATARVAPVAGGTTRPSETSDKGSTLSRVAVNVSLLACRAVGDEKSFACFRHSEPEHYDIAPRCTCRRMASGSAQVLCCGKVPNKARPAPAAKFLMAESYLQGLPLGLLRCLGLPDFLPTGIGCRCCSNVPLVGAGRRAGADALEHPPAGSASAGNLYPMLARVQCDQDGCGRGMGRELQACLGPTWQYATCNLTTWGAAARHVGLLFNE